MFEILINEKLKKKSKILFNVWSFAGFGKTSSFRSRKIGRYSLLIVEIILTK
jgi:hypothetical protein